MNPEARNQFLREAVLIGAEGGLNVTRLAKLRDALDRALKTAAAPLEPWVLASLERIADDYQGRAEKLADQGDYNCQFPEAEAKAVRMVLAHLRATPSAPTPPVCVECGRVEGRHFAGCKFYGTGTPEGGAASTTARKE